MYFLDINFLYVHYTPFDLQLHGINITLEYPMDKIPRKLFAQKIRTFYH